MTPDGDLVLSVRHAGGEANENAETAEPTGEDISDGDPAKLGIKRPPGSAAHDAAAYRRLQRFGAALSPDQQYGALRHYKQMVAAHYARKR
jgi:hypothetical protein